MENKKAFLAGSVIATAILGLSSTQINAGSISNYSDLGSGSQLRAELLGEASSDMNAIELTCGGKDSTKTAEHKCGEGKCGKDSTKTKEHKCGEGKCGDKSKEHKCGEDHKH